MAKRVVHELVDDLDGGAAEESIVFGLDSQAFEIDLSSKNAAVLRDKLAPFVGAARKVRPSNSIQRRAVATRTAEDRERLAAIRSWANTNGHQVSDRGRVSAAIQDAYDAAH